MIFSLIKNIASALLVVLALFGCSSDVSTSWYIDSPNKNVKVNLFEKDGALFYLVRTEKSIVIDTSRLGIIRKDTDLSNDLSLVGESDLILKTEDLKLQTGKQTSLSKKFHSKTYSFINLNGKLIDIQFRVFDEGVALRYAFPEQNGDVVRIESDLLEFNLSGAKKTWIQAYDEVSQWTPAYEKYYENGISIDEAPRYENGWCFPALFSMGNNWVLLSEAGIDGDYPGSHLTKSKSGIFRLRWPEENEGNDFGDDRAEGKLPWKTSWKTIAIGDMQTIMSSDLVKLVSKPAEKNYDWVKPGRASWSWLSDHPSPQNFDKLKSFVDLAAEMGWEYSLVDANWNVMKGGNLIELISYAKSQNVELLVWYNSGGPHNIVTEQPRDIMSNPELRKKEFAWLNEMGVRGVKIDFFQSDKQFAMELYRDILEDAADNEIMVNFHGCAIPRGWSRTYPNLMTMESVRGAESYTFASDYAESAPELNTILPYTRNVIGSMDYTPVIFTDMEYPHITSYGHELALSVVFESGWLHFGDAVSGYMNLPEVPKKLLSEIPVTWDEIKYVSGTPGEDVVLARRKGMKWYVAGINGQQKSKQWNIDLSFIASRGQITLVADGASDEELISSEMNGEDMVAVDVLPYGGFLMTVETQSDQ